MGGVRGRRRIVTTAVAGGGGGGQAAYPSPLHVASNHILDANNYDLGVLKGFNTNVASTVGGENFAFSQANYDAQSTLTNGAAVAGPGIVRLVCHWDVFEQSSGVIHGLTTQSNPLSAATAGSAIDSLDISITRAYNSGRYVVLDLPHLNVGRVPAWAQTGTTPSGAGNEWTWLCTNGQNLISKISARYADTATSPIGAAAAAVVGLCPNEPTDSSLPNLMTGFETIVPWYRANAPQWPIWFEGIGYGNGTPYPTSGSQLDTTRLLALDSNNVGIVFSWHTYLNNVGTASTNGYQANGTIDPIQQIANGSQYHGWGGNYNYPNTSGSRTALANHIAWWTTLKAVSGRIALAVTEFGMDNLQSGHDAFVDDTIDSFRNAGACVEVWWQYGTAQTNFDSGSTTGSGWRSAISGTGWMGNTTTRA